MPNKNVGSAPSPTPQDIRDNRSGLDYPLEAMLRNEEGIVGLKITLTEQGTASSAVVAKSSGSRRLDNAAIEYVMDNWHYQGGQDGQSMPAEVQINVTFDLR